MPLVIQRVCQELDVLSTGAMEKALLDPDTAVPVIEQIKGHAKRMTKSTPSIVEKEAATVLYFAAIASGLVFHNTRITKSSYAKLERSFETLSAKTWVSKEIAALLDDGRKVSATKSHCDS